MDNVSAWRGSYPGVIAGFKTESYSHAINLNPWSSQNETVVLGFALFVGDTSRKPIIETHTTRNSLFPVSTSLHVHKILRRLLQLLLFLYTFSRKPPHPT